MTKRKCWIAGLFLCSFFLLFAGCAASAESVAQEPFEPETMPEVCAEAEPLTESSPTCTLIIRCDTILDHMEDLTPGKEALVPADGLLLEAESVPFTEGESVFDVLSRELQERKLHLEFSRSEAYETAYIEGICNLYEFDCGELSGWVYHVNGESQSYGCAQYVLMDGDVVEWLYTCDMGSDLE